MGLADPGDQTQKHRSGLEDRRVKLSKEAAAPSHFLTPHSGHHPPNTGLRASLPSRPSALDADAAPLSRYQRVIYVQGCFEPEVLLPMFHA